MTTMLDRIAEAFADDRFDNWRRHWTDGDLRKFQEVVEEDFYRDAEIALSAMEKPTEAMQAALVAALQSADGVSPNELWLVMLRAAKAR